MRLALLLSLLTAGAAGAASQPPDVRAATQLTLRGGVGLGLSHAPFEPYLGVGLSRARLLGEHLGFTLEVGAATGARSGTMTTLLANGSAAAGAFRTVRSRALLLVGPVLRFDDLWSRAALVLGAGVHGTLVQYDVTQGTDTRSGTERRLGFQLHAGFEVDGAGPGSLVADVRALSTPAGTAGAEQLSTNLQLLVGYALWFR